MDYSDLLLIDNNKKVSAVDDALRFLSTSKYSSTSLVGTLLALNNKLSSTEILDSSGRNQHKDSSFYQENIIYNTFGEQLSNVIDSHISSKSPSTNSLSESVIRSQISELMADLSEESRRSLVDCLLLSAPSGRSALGSTIEYLKAHGVDMPTVFTTCEHLKKVPESVRNVSIPRPLPRSDKTSQPTLTLNTSSSSSSSSFPFWSPSTERNFQYFLDWMHGSNHDQSPSIGNSDGQQEKDRKDLEQVGTEGSCGVLRARGTTRPADNNNDKKNKRRTAAAYSNHRLVLPSKKKARGATTTTTTVFVDQEQRLSRGDFSAISFLADIADHMLLVDELKVK